MFFSSRSQAPGARQAPWGRARLARVSPPCLSDLGHPSSPGDHPSRDHLSDLKHTFVMSDQNDSLMSDMS